MKVSVCIPTYNQGAFLEEAVRSAYRQTLSPLEIIVANDCSTDNTVQVLHSLLSEISCLKVINQPQNLGISRNTDACLRAATGDFIVRLDSDDCLDPNYIEKLSVELSKDSRAGYAHAAVQEIDQFGNHLRQRKLFRKSGFQTGNDALKGAVTGYRVAANIIMFRRSALAEVGYIMAKTNFGEDYYLSASLAAAGYGNIYLDNILSYYRIWLDAGKVRQKRKLSEIVGYRKIFEEVLEPAYASRGWKLDILKKSRTSFACINADCLSWQVYSVPEKKELVNELYNLSNTHKTKFFIWMYLNGFEVVLSSLRQFSLKTKILLKQLISTWRN